MYFALKHLTYFCSLKLSQKAAEQLLTAVVEVHPKLLTCPQKRIPQLLSMVILEKESKRLINLPGRSPLKQFNMMKLATNQKID